MTILAANILMALDVDFDWSDAIIRPGMPMILVSPSGNRPYGEPCSAQDIADFAAFATTAAFGPDGPSLIDRLKVGSIKPALDIDSAGGDASTKIRLRLTISKALCEGDIIMVVRRVPTSAPRLKDMGIDLASTTSLLKGSGLVLVTGPTKQGKSTLMASLIEELRNTNERISHIVKIEDPIELRHEQNERCIITQREIGVHATSYRLAAEDALRMAPGAISLGEIREAEDAVAALNLGESGHLVFVTMQATTVEGALLKLKSLASSHHGAAETIAQSTKAVIRTALVPTVDGNHYRLAYEWIINEGSEIPELIGKWQTTEIRNRLRQRGLGTLGQSLNASLVKLVESRSITAEAARGASNDGTNLVLPGDSGVAFAMRDR